MGSLFPSQLLLLFALGAGGSPSDADMRCGAYCLYVSLRALGVLDASYSEFEKELGQPTSRGYSLGELAEFAKNHGLHTLGVVTNTDRLRRRPKPFACIALLDGNHFVNVIDVAEREAWIVDPPNDYRLPTATLAVRWDGTALLLSRTELLREEDLPPEYRRSFAVYVWACGAVVGITVVLIFKRRAN